MSDARRRKFDVILVWKMDRWARSLRWLINSLAELEHLGVAFISYRDNIDLELRQDVIALSGHRGYGGV